MKIGILTLRPRYNYGGILQCLALQETLRGMGHEVRVISFISNRKGTVTRRVKLLLTDFSFRVYFSWMYDNMVQTMGWLGGKRKREAPVELLENCRAFLEHSIHFTEDCDENSIGTLIQKEGFDAIVIGSDKVWGGLGHKQLTYFGDWKPAFNGKLISYAACSSIKRIPRFNREKLRALLSRFDAVSVRDEYTAKLIEPYLAVKPQIVADPTILYDFDRFVQKQDAGSGYIFAYILGREIKGGHRAAIREMKGKLGDIPVKAVVFRNQATDIAKYADEVLDDVSPDKWVSLLAGAKIVYTDSFHASVFALKYQRRLFSYFSEETRSTRLIAMRDIFGINSSIVGSVADAISKNTVSTIPDYTHIANQMQQMKQEAVAFLNYNFSQDANTFD